VGDEPVGATRANEEGGWTVQPEAPILPGLYTLRVDLLSDEDGSVLERIEVPFERATPRDIVLRGGHVVVQPGNSLWRISRAVYGEGIRYTVIYAANAEQIRDPDLIYPGQIFDVPGQQ
jgi:nucleoid-associated protein YgaU